VVDCESTPTGNNPVCFDWLCSRLHETVLRARAQSCFRDGQGRACKLQHQHNAVELKYHQSNTIALFLRSNRVRFTNTYRFFHKTTISEFLRWPGGDLAPTSFKAQPRHRNYMAGKYGGSARVGAHIPLLPRAGDARAPPQHVPWPPRAGTVISEFDSFALVGNIVKHNGYFSGESLRRPFQYFARMISALGIPSQILLLGVDTDAVSPVQVMAVFASPSGAENVMILREPGWYDTSGKNRDGLFDDAKLINTLAFLWACEVTLPIGDLPTAPHECMQLLHTSSDWTSTGSISEVFLTSNPFG
jgi:hypothetical protein